MAVVHKYSNFFDIKEAKDNKKSKKEEKTPSKNDDLIRHGSKKDKEKFIRDLIETKNKERKEPEENYKGKKRFRLSDYMPFLSKKKEDVTDQESQPDMPVRPYTPPSDWDDIPRLTKDEEPEEDPVDVETLDIQIGDYVKCKDFEDLNDNQIKFLNEKPYHKVLSVCDSKGRYLVKGEPHINLGYKIPFKMRRFDKVDRNVMGRYKVLFIQFDLKIDTHEEEDKHNFFRGKSTMSELFPELFNERLPDTFVDFCQYDDIHRIGQDFYVEDLKLRDYDFVFFGFMSNFTTIVTMLISYLDKHKVPYLKYGTYKHLDNKAYEMHLVEELGYPYIPSMMASKVSRRVLDKVREWGFPVIVKDINLNRGEGVWKVENMRELMKHFSYGGFGGSKLMLIQKFIPNDGDYRVISIKNKVELVIKKERVSDKEFRANVARGGKAVKGSLPPDVIYMCEDISKHLICDIVGFDIIMDKETGQYYVMETNSSPHFPTFSVISEINIPGILVNYIIKKIKK